MFLFHKSRAGISAQAQCCSCSTSHVRASLRKRNVAVSRRCVRLAHRNNYFSLQKMVAPRSPRLKIRHFASLESRPLFGPEFEASKMATLESLPNTEALVRNLIETRRLTHTEVAEELKLRYPSTDKGISVRSVQRFCSAHNIHRTSRLQEQEVDRLVSINAMKVSCHGRPTGLRLFHKKRPY